MGRMRSTGSTRTNLEEVRDLADRLKRVVRQLPTWTYLQLIEEWSSSADNGSPLTPLQQLSDAAQKLIDEEQ